MDRLKLMQIMNKAYGDDTLAGYYNSITGEPIRVDAPDAIGRYGPMAMVAIPSGDTLAAFIVAEAQDMWSGTSRGAELDVDEVIRAMHTAQRDLQNVIDALEEAYE